MNKSPKEYEDILCRQAEICSKIFNKPISVLSGAAGTGKTTIIKSIIKAIEKAHGLGTSFYLLAPTGKAADRIRAKTQKPASTIHSFLAGKDWLNDNLSYKREGGQIEDSISTIIIDESSMIDLELFAALFRAINWNSVQRLILVGDPNQLPPIGRGKVFYEIIELLKNNYPENIGKLDINVRHLENTVLNLGTGILDLSSIFIQENQKEDKFDKHKVESTLKKVQEGGEIDNDLEIIYWNQKENLENLLEEKIISDLEHDSGMDRENEPIYKLWEEACKGENKYKKPSYLQVLSPFRGDIYGTENLNTILQSFINEKQVNRSTLESICLFDKVIQYRNRPKSDPISAYDLKLKKQRKIDIYNGEIGFVIPHAFDKNKFYKPNFILKKFQVVFDRKDNYLVNYGYGENNNGKTLFNENVEQNLELGYAISVHKSQGSEFDRVYLVLPNRKSTFLSMELLYTAITRAQKHLTIFIQDDISTIQSLTRCERSNLNRINSSVLSFDPIPLEILSLASWYEEGKIIHTLTDYLVRSKSEMNIANILCLKDIPFTYETPLFASDGTMYLPDFTITWQGEKYYWEHVGRLDIPGYKKHWKEKQKWYEKHFPGKLITTYESYTAPQ